MIDTIKLASQLGVVEMKGAWIYYPDKETSDKEHRWQGEDSFKQYLSDNKDFYEIINKATLDKYNNSNKEEVMKDDDDTDRKNAEKETLEDLKTTSKDNSAISDGSDEFKEGE